MMKTAKFDANLIKHGNDSFTLKQRRVRLNLTSRPDRQQETLKKKHSPINNSESLKGNKHKLAKSSHNNSETNEDLENEFQKPAHTLYRKDKLNLSWNNILSIGSGLRNLGNTCFLNSVLQCLTYTPPLTNILLASEHGRKCKNQQFCMMCELEKHVAMALGSGKGSVVPRSIASRIKNIAKHMRIGRQEDAHEFLRFVIEGLQNSVLRGYEKLDNRIKETNMIYQIFGGYLRSQVKCLECKYNSNTYDPCLDLSLDIKGCDSVKRALELFVKPEILSKGNKYKCSRCKKLTNAQKQITIYQAPMVLTIQLKRFDFTRSFYGGGKIGKIVSFDEVLNLNPYMSKSQHENAIYHLYAVLVHYGGSCNSGHYYCFVKNSNGNWYEMNDSSVSPVSLKTVLRQPAYLLFYVRDPSSVKTNSIKINKQQENENTLNIKITKNDNNNNNNNMKNMKKRKLEEITKEITHPNKEIKKSMPKTSKLDEELKELTKKQTQTSSEEPRQKKIKLLLKTNDSTHKKTEEEKETKKIHDTTISSTSDELSSEKIGSKTELKKEKEKENQKEKHKEKQKSKESTSTSTSTSSSSTTTIRLKQTLLNSLLKSTSNSSTANKHDDNDESSIPKKDSKSQKSSKHNDNSNDHSNSVVSKEDHTHKSKNNWAVFNNDDEVTHEESNSHKPKKFTLLKIGNWVIKEKKGTNEFKTKDHTTKNQLFRRFQDKMNKKRKESLKIKLSQKKRIRKMKTKNLRKD